MAFIVLALVTGFCVYRFIKYLKNRPVPSPEAVLAKIIGGGFLVLLGTVVFFAWMFTEVKKPEYNLLDVLFVLPIIFKSGYADSVKGTGETFGIMLAVIGVFLLVWGIWEAKKYGSTKHDRMISEEEISAAFDELDRQLSDGSITQAKYEEKKRKLLFGSRNEMP